METKSQKLSKYIKHLVTLHFTDWGKDKIRTFNEKQIDTGFKNA